ncbi:cell division protein FtsQ [Maritimibacter alkaliphilus HTCC2654]|uniref:Cell division protein FtsQ n=1 Tax=Maritimibacter alkaliphilus HTCC2654 TaxID=314271 RepID=A3VI05_9RHOB|nr:cell division protein FtsQ/DivIB [Maritimibacter alkaliphilus]EAQ12004.1 cell division septal protein FtsQ [Rhodobacterales bacterium HTCC2654] [Maritimibacter alkaliphilus HTCC2654]TYP83058.1 cell division protein FtsQ [Maritimibacter alkaliphilus HTCC2654]
MQSLIANRGAPHTQSVKRDPAPSRWAYRIHRIWLTPVYRAMLRVGLPSFILLFAAGWYISNPTNRFAIVETVSEIRRSVETRPEFAVKLMAVEGASPVLDHAIRDIVAVEFPVSSFDLDLEALQAQISAFDVVQDVALRIRPGGVLEVAVTERTPVIIWRHASGIDMLDATGHRVASLKDRGSRPDLPLIVGPGAGAAVAEARAILEAAGPIAPRLRGLVRVGERRWDLVLEPDQRIMLPEIAPIAALEQVLALDEAQDVLARDLTHIDMRNPARPTLRMTQPAVEELRRIRSLDNGER